MNKRLEIIKQIIPDNYFYVAVSGGVDSIVCAHFLQNHKLYKDRFSIVHVNNQLTESDDIAAKSVGEFAKEIKCHIKVYTTDKDKALNIKGSKEDWARKERHCAYSKIVPWGKIVILCHHLDDAITSHLFNVLRGKESHFPIPLITHFHNLGFSVSRPFVLNEKKVLRNYADKHNLNKFIIEDDLNSDNNLVRNFLGKEVLPLIHSKKHFNLNKVVKKKILNRIGLL